MTHHLILQLRDLEECTFLVELQLNRPYNTRGSDLSTWEVNQSSSLHFSLHDYTKFCVFFRPWQHYLTWTGSSHLPCFGHFLSHTCGRRRTYLACINCLEEYQNDFGGLEVWLTIPLAVCGNVDSSPTEEENPELHLTQFC